MRTVFSKDFVVIMHVKEKISSTDVANSVIVHRQGHCTKFKAGL